MNCVTFFSQTIVSESIKKANFLKCLTYLLSKVCNLQVRRWRSVSCSKWASCNDSSPNKSYKISNCEIPEKLGNPARLMSAIHSLRNLASRRMVPSIKGTFLFWIACFISLWESRRRAMSSTWQVNPENRRKKLQNHSTIWLTEWKLYFVSRREFYNLSKHNHKPKTRGVKMEIKSNWQEKRP